MHRCYRAVLNGAGQGREEGQPANDWSYIRLCHGRARLPVDKAGAKADKPAVCTVYVACGRQSQTPQRPPETPRDCLPGVWSCRGQLRFLYFVQHAHCLRSRARSRPASLSRSAALRCAVLCCTFLYQVRPDQLNGRQRGVWRSEACSPAPSCITARNLSDGHGQGLQGLQGGMFEVLLLLLLDRSDVY